jgi:hypothetical protein
MFPLKKIRFYLFSFFFEGDGVVLYDTWIGNDFGLGNTVSKLSYRCLDIQKDPKFTMQNSINSNLKSRTRPPSSPSQPIELKITTKDQEDMREAFMEVRDHLKQVRVSAARVQASVGATFKQVSRDLEVFVLHVLSVVSNNNNNNNQNKEDITSSPAPTPQPTPPSSINKTAITNTNANVVVGGVRVICSMVNTTSKENHDDASNTFVKQVDERIVRVGSQHTGIPAKTYVFDDVVASDEESISSMVGKSITTNSASSGSGSMCIVSVGLLNNSKRATSSTHFFHSLTSIFQSFIQRDEDTEYSMTVCELVGDTFYDILQKDDHEEHILQHSNDGNIPVVWLTNMISVRINNEKDFQRVLNIVHARRSR